MSTAVQNFSPDARVISVDSEVRLGWLLGLLTKAFSLAGHTADKSNLKLLVIEISRDLESRYRLLSVEEIETIIADGVRGEFGDYFGINVATINKWFKTYIDSGRHNEYLASKVKNLNLLLPEKTELTNQERADILKAGALRCFNEYKSKGTFLDFGNPVFDFLYLRKIIKVSDAQINIYLQQAKNAYKISLQQKANSNRNIYEARDAAKLLKSICNLSSEHSFVQADAKNRAMADYFKNLIDKKQDFETILKSIQS